jgi:Na+/proline symporter
MSSALVVVNILFLGLGAMLYLYAEQKGIGGLNFDSAGALVGDCNLMLDGECYKKDQLFPFLSVTHFPPIVGVCFILGLMAAAYSSADSALTALTTSFCVDILPQDENKISKRTRYLVHIGFSVVLLIVIIIFKNLNDDSVINNLFKAAGYTYGPLLGMFFFGIISKRKPKDILIPFICIVAPVLTYIIDAALTAGGFKLGFLILLLNGLLTWVGLFIASLNNKK